MRTIQVLENMAFSNDCLKNYNDQFIPPSSDSLTEIHEGKQVKESEDMMSLDQNEVEDSVTISYKSVILSDGHSVFQKLRSLSQEIKDVQRCLDEECEKRSRLQEMLDNTYDDISIEMQRLSLEIEAIKQEQRKHRDEIEDANQAVQDNYELLSNQDIQNCREREGIAKAVRVLTDVFGKGASPISSDSDSSDEQIHDEVPKCQDK